MSNPRFVIVPNILRDKIYEKIDEQLEKVPEAREGREIFYQQLIDYFDEHGIIPDFKIIPKQHSDEQEEKEETL